MTRARDPRPRRVHADGLRELWCFLSYTGLVCLTVTYPVQSPTCLHAHGPTTARYVTKLLLPLMVNNNRIRDRWTVDARAGGSPSAGLDLRTQVAVGLLATDGEHAGQRQVWAPGHLGGQGRMHARGPMGTAGCYSVLAEGRVTVKM
jgi:hypothetical protein